MPRSSDQTPTKNTATRQDRVHPPPEKQPKPSQHAHSTPDNLVLSAVAERIAELRNRHPLNHTEILLAVATLHTSRPRAGTTFCLTNFLSGSTPPKSTKRKRLPRSARKKKFGNAAKKKVRAEGQLFCFGRLCLTSYLVVSERSAKSIF